MNQNKRPEPLMSYQGFKNLVELRATSEGWNITRIGCNEEGELEAVVETSQGLRKLTPENSYWGVEL